MTDFVMRYLLLVLAVAGILGTVPGCDTAADDEPDFMEGLWQVPDEPYYRHITPDIVASYHRTDDCYEAFFNDVVSREGDRFVVRNDEGDEFPIEFVREGEQLRMIITVGSRGGLPEKVEVVYERSTESVGDFQPLC